MKDHFHQFQGRQTLKGEAVLLPGGVMTNCQRRTMFHACDMKQVLYADLLFMSASDIRTRRQQVTAVSGAPPIGNGRLLLSLLILMRNRYV